jgi:hypothetical protein
MMDPEQELDKALNHAFKYFEVHASQRMTIFNFFTVLSGFVAAGLATALQGTAKLAVLGIGLGILLALLSFVFWKLDERTSFLVKHAERAIAELEALTLADSGRLFLTERDQSKSANGTSHFRRLWTYGQCFRLMFGTMACTGCVGAILSALRAVNLFVW